MIVLTRLQKVWIVCVVAVVAASAVTAILVTEVRSPDRSTDHVMQGAPGSAPFAAGMLHGEAANATTTNVTGAASAASMPGGRGQRSEVSRYLSSASTRELHGDESSPVNQRFAELARRAATGDKAALLYAQTIVNQCTDIVLPATKQDFRMGEVTTYRRHLLEAQAKDCQRLRGDPNYVQIEQFAKSHAHDSLVKGIKHSIETAFAQSGAQAALKAGLRGINARPDMYTVEMVSGVFDSLGLSDYYAVTLLSALPPPAGPLPSKTEAMASALRLFACEHGMPCGPRSPLVSMLCIMTGPCVPGADLEQLAREHLLSGQQQADVMKLLAFLRQIAASNSFDQR